MASDTTPPVTARAPGADRGSDLGAALFEAVRAAPAWPTGITARIVLRTPDDNAWTIRVDRGHPALGVGADERPDTTVTGSAPTLQALATGHDSGIEAFLDGRITVRGNLSLSLRLAGMLQPRPGALAITAADVAAAGVRTFYVEAGQGPPVVLLHGLGATNASLLPTLRALSTGYRVIAPDLPGFGASAKPIRSLHAAFYASWLSAFCEAVGARRPHLLGNSMGGRVAVEAGLRHPDGFDRLVLLAPSPAFLKGREYVRLVRLLRPELALIPLPLPHEQVRRAIRRMFARPHRLDDSWYDAAADEFLRVFSRPRGRIGFFSAMRQIYLEEPHAKPGGFWARLPQLSRPALFVWGSRDRLVPVKFAPHVERLLPDATSVVLDDCGHVPQFEQPEVTHRLVRSFLDGAG